MSLIAPLLGLPGRVRKLRSYNAVKLPAAESIAPTVTEADNASWENVLVTGVGAQISRQPQAHETDFALLEGQNNAVVLSEPACNITGSGVLYGAWIVYAGYLRGTTWMKIGANIIVDGVELVDQTWEWNSQVLDPGLSAQFHSDSSFSEQLSVKIPLLGTLRNIPDRLTLSGTWYDVFKKEYVPLLKPLRFDQSLEINLIHKESEGLVPSRTVARLCAAVYEDA